MAVARAGYATVVAAALVGLAMGACQSRPDDTTSDEQERQSAIEEALTDLELRRAHPGELFEVARLEPQARLRIQAALAIARAEHVDMLEPLVELLGDKDPGVRAAAAFGVGQLDLALDPELKDHGALRRRAETSLARALEAETDAGARGALMRALGRVGDGLGLSLLINLASVRPEDRATALTALGVAGARGRKQPLNTGLARVVLQGLESSDPAEQRAAAYAAFRHGLPFAPEFASRLAATGFNDAQARIHLLRAIPKGLAVDVDVGPGLSRALRDGDWRVRVEAIRALARLEHGYDGALAELIASGQGAVSALSEQKPGKGRPAGEIHVVTEACQALVNSPRDQTAPLLQRWQRALKARAPWAACGCAVARDAQEGKVSAVDSCLPEGVDRTWARRFAVKVATQTELPVTQRVAWLATALRDASPLVRLDAAMALEAQGEPAADVALKALADERDATVAAVLMRTANASQSGRLAVEQAALNLIARFAGVTTFEKAEPLIEAATALKPSRAADVEGALAQLATHAVPQVRLAASRRPFGEREHAPLAGAYGRVRPQDLPARVLLTTSEGEIELDLERRVAPLAVQNFVDLARKGAYDGTPFHRVIPDFVAQGGDPEGTGSGGPGYTIPCENHDGAYEAGAVGMALAGKDTGGSQFFITHSAQPHLDGRYTLFARVSRGMDVVANLTPMSTIIGVKSLR